MRIVSYKFSEYVGGPREWSLHQFDLELTTLVVGRNASGKSRLLSTMIGLARLIRGETKGPFESGAFEVVIEGTAGRFEYELEYENKRIAREELSLNGVPLINRNAEGQGRIWSDRNQESLEFAIPQNSLVVSVKRDRIQHPYLEALYDWASKVSLFEFGSSLGRTTLITVSQALQSPENPFLTIGPEGLNLPEIYKRGYEQFGAEFDQSILRDFFALGYECEDVGLRPFNLPGVDGSSLVTLYVKESHLVCDTPQVLMSQGMFRALALVIHLNFVLFTRAASTLLVDDIGEGLDFERSKQFVALLVERAEAAGMQLIMTTNDRFVMNGVPLRNLAVIDRLGHEVKVVNYKNSPEIFDEFMHVGLNNFDFFAMRFFDQEAK